MAQYARFVECPPHNGCCLRFHERGILYPVVKREKTPRLECAGDERVYVEFPCGHIGGYSIWYFDNPFTKQNGFVEIA